MENPNSKGESNNSSSADQNPSNDNGNNTGNQINGGDNAGNRRRRTPFTDLSQEDADLALARTLQEQERAYMMLRMNAGGSYYGSWEYGFEGEVDDEGDDYDDASEDDYDGSAAEAEDAFDANADDRQLGNVDQISDIDLSSDESYTRALQDVEEREMASRLMALAGISELVGGDENGDEEDEDEDEEEYDDEDEEDIGGDSLDAWEDLDPDELSYEELIALGDVVGTESRGLSSDSIASLPSVKYKSEGFQEGIGDSCVICRLDYEEDETLTVLSCKHSYHTECINDWLKINKVCPVCSAEVSTSTIT